MVDQLKKELENLKRKKVELVKKSKEDGKKFNAFRMKKNKEIKAMAKVDRKQKIELKNMERQNERIQNVLRVRTQQAQLAEKKLRDLKEKQQQRVAEQARSGKAMTTKDVKERLEMAVEMGEQVRISKETIESVKKERTELYQRREKADNRVRFYILYVG